MFAFLCFHAAKAGYRLEITLQPPPRSRLLLPESGQSQILVSLFDPHFKDAVATATVPADSGVPEDLDRHALSLIHGLIARSRPPAARPPFPPPREKVEVREEEER